jgi:Eukaryotic aspartyl protease
LGLSFNDLTNSYSGTNTQADSKANYIGYSSLINTIFEVQELTSPLFSLALNRNNSTSPNSFGGVFALGGLPSLTDPAVNVTGSIVSTPMTSAGQNYNIAIDSANFGGVAGADPGGIYLVDSGSTLILIPKANADAFNALYNPPATYNTALGAYFAPCTAVPPPLSFTIGDQEFTVNPTDLLNQEQTDDAGNCVTGISQAPVGQKVLGDVFLKNVLAVFDWGNSVVSFGAREYYSTTA